MIPRGSRRRLGLGIAVAALFAVPIVRDGERIWRWLACERRAARLDDFVSSRKHVDDHRILVIGSDPRGPVWFNRTVADGERLAGWETIHRFGSGRRIAIELWDQDTGIRRTEAGRDDGEIRITSRDALGRILEQLRVDEVTGAIEESARPPWRWGAEDDTSPSAPWIREGISFGAWWDAHRPR